MKHRYWKTAAGTLSILVLAGLLSGCGAKDKSIETTAPQLNDSTYTVGIAQGASSQTVVAQEFPNAKTKYYNKAADAYLSVQQEKIDAFVYDRIFLEFAIAEGLTGVKLLPEKIGEPISIAVGISPESNVPDLQSKLNEFLAEMREDGTPDDMYRRWANAAADTIYESCNAVMVREDGLSAVSTSRVPVETARIGVMTGSTAEGEYTTLSQLSGKMLAGATGSILDQSTLTAIPDVQFSYFNNATDELAALRAGKVEGMPLDRPVAELWVAQNSDLAIVPEIVVEDHYAVALEKGSPLTADFNREIAVLKKQGILDEMYDKWISADNSGKTMPNLDYPAPNGTIRVACSTALEPMCYAGSDGVPIGFDVEMVVRVAQALGKKVELISVDFGGLIPMLQSGKADVSVGCMSISEERKQSVDLTDSYYDGGTMIVVRKAGGVMAEDTSFWSGLKQSFIRTFVTESRWKLVLDGLVVTVVLSVCSGLLGSVLGFGFCMLRRSKRRLASIPAAVLIRVIQGTPIVVLLMILYYIIFGKLDISSILVAILGFAVNFGVYVSEMIRTGIDAVDKGQIEAAHALGFTRMRTFWKITFPQAARHFLPVFKGEFISMVKMTSVVGYIAIQDLTKVSDIIRSRTLEAFFPLIATAVLYFLVANLLTILLSRLEIHLDPKHRKRAVKGVVMK